MDVSRFSLDGHATAWVAVSIERTPQCNLHAGLIYRDSDGVLRRLHFGWHRYLISQPYRPVPCAQAGLDDADEMWISGFFGRIARHARLNLIPYNLKYDEDVAFNRETGEIVFGPNSTGLGCATFVLAAFRSSGNPLVDTTGWPDADYDDIATQAKFVNLLLWDTDPDKTSQGVRIKREVGTKRIRPDHVAGACLEDVRPARYSACEENGLAIVALIDAAA